MTWWGCGAWGCQRRPKRRSRSAAWKATSVGRPRPLLAPREALERLLVLESRDALRGGGEVQAQWPLHRHLAVAELLVREDLAHYARPRARLVRNRVLVAAVARLAALEAAADTRQVVDLLLR